MQKLQLILAGPYQACLNTKAIWTEACNQYGLSIETTDLDEEPGISLEKNLNIKSFPAFIVNNEVKAVGHPNKDAAFKLVTDLFEKDKET